MNELMIERAGDAAAAAEAAGSEAVEAQWIIWGRRINWTLWSDAGLRRIINSDSMTRESAVSLTTAHNNV